MIPHSPTPIVQFQMSSPLLLKIERDCPLPRCRKTSVSALLLLIQTLFLTINTTLKRQAFGLSKAFSPPSKPFVHLITSPAGVAGITRGI